NPGVFRGMGFAWSQVISLNKMPDMPLGPSVSSVDGVPYSVGDLVQLAGKAPIYLVEGDVLRWVPSASEFNSLGLSWSHIMTVPSLSAFTVGPPLYTNIAAAEKASASSLAALEHTVQEEQGASAEFFIPTSSFTGGWMVLSNGIYVGVGSLAGTTGTITIAGSSTSVLNFGSSVAQSLGNGTILVSRVNGKDLIEIGSVSQSATILSTSSSTLAAAPIAFAGQSSSSLSGSGLINGVYGYFDDYNAASDSGNTAFVDLEQHIAAMSFIAPDWYFIKPTASGGYTIYSTASTSQMGYTASYAQAHNVQVIPSIGYSYNPADSALTSASGQSNLISQIMTIVNAPNIAGINIDFENESDYSGAGMTEAQASAQYTDFVQALGTQMAADGKKLIVALYPSSYPATIYNYPAIAPYVSYINVMAYPEHNADTTPGPTAGLQWDEMLASNLLAADVPADKLLWGVAPYGHTWNYSNAGFDVSADGATSTRATIAWEQASGIKPFFDPVNGESFVVYGNLDQTPPAELSTADENENLLDVANLQQLLNIILQETAIASGQTPPQLIDVDGYYGDQTALAVASFQKMEGVDPTGIYGTSTANAMTLYIQDHDIGDQITWYAGTTSVVDTITAVVLKDGMAGIDEWRSPYEPPGYFETLQQDFPIHKGL
ncbi:MAG: glycosyl hydrolase family 18 protein, partial [Firmicutes bacterium]|nr:glycosyl hydrolase family 18 protein [Bacillota bacterium]